MKVSFVCMAKIFLSVKKKTPPKNIKQAKKKNYNNVYNNNLFKKNQAKKQKKPKQNQKVI